MQLLMDKLFNHPSMSMIPVWCYLDNCLIGYDLWSQHLSDLGEVFNGLRKAGLKLGPNKCSFAQNSCMFWCHQVSKDGISPPEDRVKAIEQYPALRNVEESRRWLSTF